MEVSPIYKNGILLIGFLILFSSFAFAFLDFGDTIFVIDRSVTNQTTSTEGIGFASTGFTDANLVSSVFTFDHNLNVFYPVIEVFDNVDNIIVPDQVTSVDVNSVTIDLTSFAPISGTWHASAAGGEFDANILANTFVRNPIFNSAFDADFNVNNVVRLLQNSFYSAGGNLLLSDGNFFHFNDANFTAQALTWTQDQNFNSDVNIGFDLNVGNNLLIETGFIGIPGDETIIQIVTGEVDIEGDALVTGTLFATTLQGIYQTDGGVTITSSSEGFIAFTATGVADPTDLSIDLDGTRPVLFSVADNTIEIAEALIVTGTLTGNAQVVLGDGGDTAQINSSDWDISTTGVITNASLSASQVTNGTFGTGSYTVDSNFTIQDSNLNIHALTYSFPSVRGSSGQALTEDGLGNLSWTTVSSTDTTLDSNASAREAFLARDLNWSGIYDFNGGGIRVGIDGSQRGLLELFGNATTTGGNLKFYPGDSDDTVVDDYKVGLIFNDDDFFIRTEGGSGGTRDFVILDANNGSATFLKDIIAPDGNVIVGASTGTNQITIIVNVDNSATARNALIDGLKISNTTGILKTTRGIIFDIPAQGDQAYILVDNNGNNDNRFIFGGGGGSDDAMDLQISYNNEFEKVLRVGNIATAGGTVSYPFDFLTGQNSQVLIQAIAASSGRDVGLSSIIPDGTQGLDIWFDSSTDDVFIDSRSGNTDHDIVFRTRTFGTIVEAIRIKGGGNVGIGTTTPSEILEVSSTGADQFSIHRNANTAGFGVPIDFKLNDSASAKKSYARILGLITTNTAGSEDGTLTFQVMTAGAENSEKMRITHEGKVGIGVTDPDEELEVVGTIHLTGAGADLSIQAGVPTAQLHIGTVAAGETFFKASDGTPNTTLFQISRAASGNVIEFDSFQNSGFSFKDNVVAEQDVNITGNLNGGRNVFSAYANANSINLTTGSIDLNFDVEIRDDSHYTHSTVTDNQEVTINETGDYKVEFDCSMDSQAASARAGARCFLTDDGVEVDGTSCFTYNRITATGENTCSMNRIVNIGGGSIITVRVVRQSGTTVINAIADGSRLTMEWYG